MTRAATGSEALGLQLPDVLAVPNAPASIHCGDHEDHFLVLQVSYDLSNAALHNLSERKSLSYEEPPWCLFAERDVKRMLRVGKHHCEPAQRAEKQCCISSKHALIKLMAWAMLRLLQERAEHQGMQHQFLRTEGFPNDATTEC